MKDQEKNKPQAYALYSFIDVETKSKYDKYPGNLEPTLYLRHSAIKLLLAYAFKQYFDIDTTGVNLMKEKGCYKEIYFSMSVCTRAIAISLSHSPTGVSVGIPFSVDEDEFAKFNFNEKELKKYYKREYGENTLFYMYCQKQAFQKKYGLLYEKASEVDSSVQHNYTLHKDTFLDLTYVFAATDDVEFIPVDIKIILP